MSLSSLWELVFIYHLDLRKEGYDKMLLKRLSLGTADLPSIVFVLFLLQQQPSFIPTAAGQEL